MKTKVSMLATLALLSLGPNLSSAGSIFTGTPFEKVADAVGNATGTNDLQRKAGLPNAGGDIANFFEAAKKNSGPLVTAVTTLSCPGCVTAAAVISGNDAAIEAIFTTGIVTAAFQTDPLLGLATVVILASDRESGEAGFQQVVVQTDKVKRTPQNFEVKADCVIRDKAHDAYFVLFVTPPSQAENFKNGDTLNVSAPECKNQISDPTNESVTSVSISRTGGNPIGMSGGRFKYVLVGSKPA
jgi:hypothetical protein